MNGGKMASLAPCHLQQAEELAMRSSEWESWPCPSLAVALRRVGPAPYLGNRVELQEYTGELSQRVREGELTLNLVYFCYAEAWTREKCPLLSLPLATYGKRWNLTWSHESRRAFPVPHLIVTLRRLSPVPCLSSSLKLILIVRGMMVS